MTSSVEGSAVLDAFGDPTRREILLVLSEGEMSVNELADRVESVGRTAISSHLRVLRLAGVVTERRAGRYRYYSIDPTPASAVVDFVASVYRSALTDLLVAETDDSGAEGIEPSSVSA